MNESITPSLICSDLCNLEASVKALEETGCQMLHVDILDGYFSPSMPLGLDTVRQLRKKTSLAFDAHVMAVDNTFFMEELADIGVHRMCFQVETERHISHKLTWLREKGIKAGVALAPATPVSVLEYVLEQCDFVLLMMINPGYASSAKESVRDSLKKKVGDLHAMIAERGLPTTITIDGRTYLDAIPGYAAAGASTFVAGTSSLFRKNGLSLKENYQALEQVVNKALLSLQAICKRFAHLGIGAHYVGEITEPAITDKDLLIVGSGSGESLFPVAIAKKAKALGTKVAWIGSNAHSTIAELADYQVRIPVQSKLACPDELRSQQPMTSLFEQTLLLYGDAVARVIVERKALDLMSLWQYHANLE